ncbi:hypothetical protein BD324DRAFT_409240 [Kockovaella imperatae]|uniref:Uncharacterized protein n=1 Tax=Kockovaella imperatae TaxID=4999 RepID=A0A1Y1UK70_9TREE|nr:hypothetical protein BD324DRAFT_409240 [Kockovaella imperatae]ORX37937.1 hypothetical protein BD324DRAFT_409240 [Kockovaella imperatae]
MHWESGNTHRRKSSTSHASGSVSKRKSRQMLSIRSLHSLLYIHSERFVLDQSSLKSSYKMRLLGSFLGALCFFLPFVLGDQAAETFKYESDITRLRSLVIHSLYSHKDVFLRELLSNANDALEKLRLTALTDRHVMSGGEANVTIEIPGLA